MISSHQLEVPVWSVEGFLATSRHFFLILAPSDHYTNKKTELQKNILAMCLLLNEEEVHNRHILNVIVFKKTNTMNCTYDVQRDFSVFLSYIVQYLYENETIFYAENIISVIIFLQSGNFCFYHFIFRPCFPFLSSSDHKLF